MRKEIREHPELLTQELVSRYGREAKTISAYRGDHHHSISPNSPHAHTGNIWETWAQEVLQEAGFVAELMPLHHPFDILVNGKIRVDVKVATKPKSSPSTRINNLYGFHVKGEKKRKDTDFYFCIISPTEDYFIIPSSAISIQQTQVCLTWPPKRHHIASCWHSYHKRLDLLRN